MLRSYHTNSCSQLGAYAAPNWRTAFSYPTDYSKSPTQPCDMLMTSTISRTLNLRSANTISWSFSITLQSGVQNVKHYSCLYKYKYPQYLTGSFWLWLMLFLQKLKPDEYTTFLFFPFSIKSVFKDWQGQSKWLSCPKFDAVNWWMILTLGLYRNWNWRWGLKMSMWLWIFLNIKIP